MCVQFVSVDSIQARAINLEDFVDLFAKNTATDIAEWLY